VGSWFSVLIARPIEWISTRARKVAEGNLNVPMTAPAPRLMPIELRDMQADFQDMVHHLREARETQAVFISSLSHELRTPLNAMIGFSEMMKRERNGPLSDTYKEYSGFIYDAGNALLKNINDLLDLQRLASGKLNWENDQFSLNALLKYSDALCGDAVRAKGITLQWEPPTFEIDLYADKTRLGQCVTNLITNSAKFTEPGGIITVSTARNADGDLEICVADTGVGISAEDLEKIRQPFEQGGNGGAFQKNDGLGLGLAIVGGILACLGGHLSIESTLGIGTSATITVPRERLYVDGSQPEEFALKALTGAA